MIYTFWEGEMPGYIKLCLKTWDKEYVILNYSNLHNYTAFRVTEKLKRYTLPMISDCVRVHVLRDNGGYWLDADTIMLGDLPQENIAGEPDKRTNSIGYLHTEKDSRMFRMWADYQDWAIEKQLTYRWDLFGNHFTDNYVKKEKEITICDINNYQPERRLPGDGRKQKYIEFYFKSTYHLEDISSDLLMLHNSWTPNYYKSLTEEDILIDHCTMSNILKEKLCSTL